MTPIIPLFCCWHNNDILDKFIDDVCLIGGDATHRILLTSQVTLDLGFASRWGCSHPGVSLKWIVLDYWSADQSCSPTQYPKSFKYL